MTATLLIKTEDGVTTLTLNRIAQHNALDADLVTAIDQALLHLENAADTRVVKITANGPYFCAGGDLTWFKNKSTLSADTDILAQMLKHLYEFPKPVVAIAQGSAFGGGVGLLSCCDVVIAETAATFCLSEVKLGLVPATISPYIVQAIGVRQAAFLTLTAERISADHANAIGLVHTVADAENLETAAEKLIVKLLSNGPQAMRISKKLLHELSPLQHDYVDKTAQLLTEVRTSKEAQEGIQAFLEKRVAQWS